MNVLELFSGSGGLAYGFRKAGLEIAMAFDKDPEACASYHANLGVYPVQIDVHDLLRMARAGWSPGPVDFLCADPPCALWSRAGKRMLKTTVELVGLLKPRAYLIGNLPGHEDGTNLPIVQRLIGGLSRHGYCTRDDALLDAADYGVPQRRPQSYWYGHREGTCLIWPSRTHGNPRELRQMMIPGVDALLPWVSCREALAGLSLEDLGRLVNVKPLSRKLVREKKTAKGVRSAMRIPQAARVGDPDAPLATMTARPGRAFTWPGEHEGHQGPNAVVLSEKAATILQGLPPDWKLVGATKTARWAQLGQAVPPAVAEALGRSIKSALGEIVDGDRLTPRGCACPEATSRDAGRDKHSRAT